MPRIQNHQGRSSNEKHPIKLKKLMALEQHMGVRVTAPVRIDISGGWPDSDPYRADFGGFVLNAAINLRVSACLNRDLVISPGSVPPHSGLGASGALRTAELVASNPRLLRDKIGLIGKVHAYENKIIENRAGFQDEAAAIFGGVNYWEFGRKGKIRLQKIARKKAEHLEERILVIYTGQTHLSANVHDLVFGPRNYRRNIPALHRMKQIAAEMRENMANEKDMARLIDETWALQKSLHSSIETSRMRTVQKVLRQYYLAARATGAGGGGSMIFYTDDKERLMRIMRQRRRELTGISMIKCRFDYLGVRCTEFS